MRQFLLQLCLVATSILHAQIPSYYNGLNLNQTGSALKSDLAQLISQTHTTQITYNTVWSVLQKADLDPSNPSDTIVLLLYGYNDLDALTINDRTRSKNLPCNFTGNCNGYWNREHMYAQSLGTPPLATDPPGTGTDAHNLRACDVQMNSTRNNRKYTDGSGTSGQIGQDFYPGDEWKGDVARAVMYMFLRYNTQCLPINVGAGSTTFSTEIPDIFLEWNAEDPVSQLEQNRNDTIYNYQGNRNPFVDNPYLATLIWTGPTAQNFWNLDGSDIIRDATFSEPELIPYLSYQENADLTLTNSLATGTFLVRDGGQNGDADNLPTTVTRLDFQLTNSTAIRRVALFAGNAEIGEVNVNGQNISFTNLNVQVADNDSTSLTLRASFTTNVADYQQIGFQVIYVVTAANGSSMSFSNGGGASTSTTGNKNKLNVIATGLSFTVAPSNVLTHTPMAPAIVLACNDAAGNVDVDYTQSVVLSATMNLGAAAVGTITPANGLATFANIQFDESNRSVTLFASSGTLIPAESSNFSVSEILLGWDLTGLTNYGPSPYGPSTNAVGFLSDGWTRGTGITTGGTAGLNAWGGNGMISTSASAAITAQDIVSFTGTVPSGKVLYSKAFRPYNIRVSSSGATSGQWQYRINGGAFVDLGPVVSWGNNFTSSGNMQSEITLSNISALQGLASGTSVTFRIILWGATTTSGNWYLNAFQAGDDVMYEGFWERGSQATDHFRTKNSGVWDNAVNWESSSDGISWYAATLFPGVMAQSIKIRNGHMTQVTNSQSASHLTAEIGATLLVVTGGNLLIQE